RGTCRNGNYWRGIGRSTPSAPSSFKPRYAGRRGEDTMQAEGMQSVPELVESLLNRAERLVVGQRNNVEMVLLALLCGGHGLREGVPGTGKTLTARALARLLALDCKRVQFTPDLMPSDVVGTNVFNLQTSRFEFRPGPVFTDLLIADEINRTPPKTQS